MNILFDDFSIFHPDDTVHQRKLLMFADDLRLQYQVDSRITARQVEAAVQAAERSGAKRAFVLRRKWEIVISDYQ